MMHPFPCASRFPGFRIAPHLEVEHLEGEYRVITRTIAMLCRVAALATLGLGVVSYWRGIPGDTLWIDAADEQPRLRLAVIGGTIPAVHSEPGQGRQPL